MELPPAFKHAIKIAQTSIWYPYKLGAVVVRQGKVIGRGANGIRKHGYSHIYNFPMTLHAEAAAILNTPKHLLEGSDLYVVRISKNNEVRMSKPCDCCITLAKMVGIKNVHYSTHNDYETLDMKGI